MSSAPDFVGLHELAAPNRQLWKSMVAEFLGVLIIVFFGCGSCVRGWEESDSPTTVQISLAFGFSVTVACLSLGHVSGGHFNPAVTFSFLVSGHCNLVRSFLYIVAQCLGGIAGAAILKGITPEQLHGNLGQTSISPLMTTLQGFIVEMIITAALVLTVFAVTDPNRPKLNHIAPFVVGLNVTLCHLFAIKYTGSSMNPARDFGPSVITASFGDHWVYWVGPLTGGVVGAIFYSVLFSAEPLINATTSCLSEACGPKSGGTIRGSTTSILNAFRKNRNRSSHGDHVKDPFADDSDDNLEQSIAKAKPHGTISVLSGYTTLALQENIENGGSKRQTSNGSSKDKAKRLSGQLERFSSCSSIEQR